MSLGSEYIDQVRAVDLVSYLARLGIEPQKISGNNYWYLSPLRDEKSPSFKVNRTLNRWYDFGEGIGGSLIDFGIRYHQCSVSDFLSAFKADLLLLPAAAAVSRPVQQPKESKIKVTSVAALERPALLAYLTQRKIDIGIARLHCQQVHYQIAGRSYYAIGFANDSGGYELRNPYSKLGSSPKDITLIDNQSDQIAVFEGFFDFLSYRSFKADTAQRENYLVLNSAAFFSKAMPNLQTYRKVDLYLDQDQTGRLLTARAQAESGRFIDQSALYQGFKDLNEYHVAVGNPLKNQAGKNLGLDLSL
ncbi:toprim domain-containing protein [Dyadobacter sp. CY261]|uniref:toprim domain-containing protein n=1 Tax=Dyadobacter sp. CY261 TaxID=2907203 RepID=UPI001F2EDC3B|nr:toprim domain-containing protein [Dyadobacter sp. CY261]MCF0075392.1 toprim domain-containing protein [Dyadobacter sp. CY261]